MIKITIPVFALFALFAIAFTQNDAADTTEAIDSALFIASEPGQSCDQACEAVDELCREDMLFPQTAEEVQWWAQETGVTCDSVRQRCDMGESPIFIESQNMCTFCGDMTHPGWTVDRQRMRPLCARRYGDRKRICPCTQGIHESLQPTVAPSSSPSFSSPTNMPTVAPSSSPSISSPTASPSAVPPTKSPSDYPSTAPTAAQVVVSEPGQSCDHACEALDEECIEDMLFPQTAEEVQQWAQEIGITCTSIQERCDMGESPIFIETLGLCTFCGDDTHPGWTAESQNSRPLCARKAGDRMRVCPCTQSRIQEVVEFVQGGLCGTDWSDMMLGAIEVSRNNGGPAIDPEECAQLVAANDQCGSYFVARNDYDVCWCMAKDGVHAECSIRYLWEIHSTGESYGNIYRLNAGQLSAAPTIESPTVNPPTAPTTDMPTRNPSATPTVSPSEYPSTAPTAKEFVLKIKGFHGAPSDVVNDEVYDQKRASIVKAIYTLKRLKNAENQERPLN